ncbi:MAG: SRPBCC domain-containing protein [Thermomicrobiales bacterium]|nr:SRPBCC domain-containing protein [Thermomicrobiales bacterium]MCO5220259.1 SRPBCC domain-containing protein [Thermomicrobiales bacterium]
MHTSSTTRTIAARPDTVYRAFVDPDLLVQWQAPDHMTAQVHWFDPRPGGGYEMSLFYDDPTTPGKTGNNEDRYTARFIELVPPRKIVEVIQFDSADPDLAGDMTMTVEIEAIGVESRITITFENLPAGVSADDNDLGTQQSIAKLARLVESQPSG